MKTTVSIIGLGLIGGSLGLALKRNPDVHVTGFDRSYATADEAFRRGIIDTVAPSAKSACEQADFVIFATPVNTTVALFEEAVNWNFRENAIVSDTGSTKKPIMQAAEALKKKGIHFIGGHPMAGSHKSGVSAALEHLFENAYYILTPADSTTEEQITRLENVLESTKAKLIVLQAEEHDRMTAIISHFPHIVASSLVGRLAAQEEGQPFVKRLAAGGFRDLTRIASADPIMWRDITIQNREELLSQVDGWLGEMNNIRAMLVENNSDHIYNFFNQAKEYRDQLPSTYDGATQGALYMTFDLHIDVPDHPGVISEITKILAEADISLTNIRIVETRTDVYGILVVSFQSAAERKRARQVLSQETDYSMHVL
ncbi:MULTISPECIES: prephenate dehydrogenase [unclassified Sporosarcina]|uniref:prephenate dehydrogenase n=1 Tax=unclassified Sporosarcina TaxID=2647733 RepID=UPI00203C0649|nr:MULTISPECIES: prephenate dehydrogenase [unclassified Sporosarcina]GKV65686.1 prephenate dehydrogenase [Sporosarcina sp. NCCP-2331]GLB55734.1 prephenate dehydrogenase [Sporosarcina sp. NCCP-2378]